MIGAEAGMLAEGLVQGLHDLDLEWLILRPGDDRQGQPQKAEREQKPTCLHEILLGWGG